MSNTEDVAEPDEEYSDDAAIEDEDDAIDGDESSESEFGVTKKIKPKIKIKVQKLDRQSSGGSIKKKCEFCSTMVTSANSFVAASAAFPSRKQRSESADGDYASKSHRKKTFVSNARGTSTPTGFDSDGTLRRDAAKKVRSYNETEVDYGLDSEDDVMYYPQGSAGLGEWCAHSVNKRLTYQP